ncbi:xanthine dehydrogenase family protein molybdopterin-binding subunit [Litorilinea aerophila]|uniref:Molybdopterin-dependent oxidoreductase n=1 Tax=Litorilinea aerophila TaxID=1204385 RepID=A0A540VD22_9CHLR|nr:molybdopterin cofactor-binding domain-containing protein [Litorilinea aerophila]MCC9077621.1 xanthine dehydrogenase family protein molybdopterin-binding subunit [Litorilinea aerophila]GIV79773.1 MAG: aldehyde dehydrogenase [Litorilinea sp.]
MTEQGIGAAIRRREDPALITGKAKYTDDLQLPNMAYVAILRSPYSHARIRSIDTSAAKALDGVVAVFTGQDVADSGIPGTVPVGWLLPNLKTPAHPILAKDTVRYVGDGVAVVVAEDRYTAYDALELIQVDYEPLPAVVNPKAATQEGAPQIHEEAPRNIAFDWEIGDKAATDAAFANAAHVARLELVNNRLIPNAMEPRAALADYNNITGELTLYMTTQNPHIHRLLMSLASLGLPEHKIRVIAPEVGGGFGSKIHHYPDEAIVSWCSMQLGRPVKWTATRSETYLTDAHGRDHVTTAEMALDENGKILGLRVETYAAMGAYLSTFAPAVPTYLYGTLLSGEYDIPAIHCHVIGTFTTTAPVDAYRGAGRPEATYVVERLMDQAARVTGLDPVEIRRRNFVSPDKFPFQTQVALQYDSGNYPAALEKALSIIDYDKFRQEQAALRQQGRYLGIGFSCYIEACGLAPSQVVGSLGAQAGQWESAVVRVLPTGKVMVYSGSSGHGQGHKTTFAQIVASELGVPYEDVEIIEGDTAQIPHGWGTYGSRSAAVGGSAIAVGARKVVEKARKIAAHLLEAAEEDLAFENGKFYVKGSPDQAKTIQEVALQAYLAHNLPKGIEPALESTTFYDPSNFTFPFGTHVAIVEVFPETGRVELRRYLAVDDVGNMINPMIVHGQIHGGIAQGVGQALFESAVYDESGNLVTGTMMDYAVPKAHFLPSFETEHTVTPCPHNPLGVKGVGEAGTIASPAAVINAVVDALSPFGVEHVDMPVTPEKVWRLCHRNGGQ